AVVKVFASFVIQRTWHPLCERHGAKPKALLVMIGYMWRKRSILLVISRCSSLQMHMETLYTLVNASAASSVVTRSSWRNALPPHWMGNCGIGLRPRLLT